jgi:S1-C subfamily serine protease
VTDVYRQAAAGVVEIATSGAAGQGPLDQFGQGREQEGVGSGFVLDTDGHIVTNYHVVEGAETLKVTFADGTERQATVVGTDPSTDLAVIEVDAPSSALKPLALGDSSSVEVGELVIAIGSPYGLEGTATAGIVSALDRQITAPNGYTISGAIQTDAAINQGSSGGPLLDARGKVIGVSAQIESESGGNVGLGFAIPSSTVRAVVSQLVSGDEVEHAYLGVEIATVPAEVAEALGAPAQTAVEITRVVSGSPAARAGLRAATETETVDGQSYPSGGDLVTAVDGERVESSAELQAAISAGEPGDEVKLTIYRDGSRQTVTVTLGSRPS